MTSELVIGIKWLFGVPVTWCAGAYNEDDFAGEVGTPKICAYNVNVPITSVPVTSIYCTSIYCGCLLWLGTKYIRGPPSRIVCASSSGSCGLIPLRVYVTVRQHAIRYSIQDEIA